MAGLRAATVLAGARKQVLLLEGRDRLGGRIHSLHEPGWPVLEAGAEFVHGTPPALERLRRRSGIRRIEQPDRHLHSDGRRLRPADREWEQAMALLEHLPRQPPDRSYAQLSRERGWQRLAGARVQHLARAFVEGFNAAPAGAVSAVSLGRQTAASSEIQGDRLLRLEGGYGRLVEAMVSDALRAGVTIRTGARVERLRWRAGAVTVQGRGVLDKAMPVVHARAAVLTLPLGVLKARPPARGAVRFSPELPADKLAAIERLLVGPVMRMALRFAADTPGLQTEAFTFLHVDGAAFPTFWRLPAPARQDTPTLLGWSAGPAAQRLAGRSPEQRLRAAVRSLGRGLLVSPTALLQALEGWRLFDWQDDPFTRGAYSFAPPGGAELPGQLAAPVADTLFFAGEATHTDGATGTVHGALETGDRAARLLLRAWEMPEPRPLVWTPRAVLR